MKTIKQMLADMRNNNNLGVLDYLNDDDLIKLIAEQAQDILGNGERYSHIGPSVAYNSVINQFGEQLVKEAIKLYKTH